MCVEHKLEIEFQQKVEKYTCMQDKGEQQTESFKALDFADHWTTNLYCFNESFESTCVEHKLEAVVPAVRAFRLNCGSKKILTGGGSNVMLTGKSC